jgi:hypothetical protein
MPSQIICRDAWIKGWTTICNRRIPELAFEWIPRHWSLSISIATYRPQAGFFGGVSDGKSSAA